MPFAREFVEIEVSCCCDAMYGSLYGRCYADRVRCWAMEYLERAALQKFLSISENLMGSEFDFQNPVRCVNGDNDFVQHRQSQNQEANDMKDCIIQ